MHHPAKRLPRSSSSTARLLGKKYSSLSTTLRTFVDSVADDNAKPVGQQLAEMIKLRRSRTKLSPAEYHMYRMQDRRIYDGNDLSAICKSRMRQWLHTQLNNPNWDGVVSDKINMAMIFDQANIPQARLFAVYSPFDRQCGDTPILRTRNDLVDFLTGFEDFPVFVKPVKGGSGAGCQLIEKADQLTGELILGDGQRCSVSGFIDGLHDPSGWGFTFQEAMKPAPATVSLAGDRITGVRMVVLLGDDGPRLFRATWKIPGVDSVTDNYGIGDKGTIVAHLDVESGQIERTIQGMWLDMEMDLPHPVTGVSLRGHKMPGWDEAVEATLNAARAFPGFRFQHWDLGLSSDGPVMFELNTVGDCFDMGAPVGTFDAELIEFIERYSEGQQHQSRRSPVAD